MELIFVKNTGECYIFPASKSSVIFKSKPDKDVEKEKETSEKAKKKKGFLESLFGSFKKEEKK